MYHSASGDFIPQGTGDIQFVGLSNVIILTQTPTVESRFDAYNMQSRKFHTSLPSTPTHPPVGWPHWGMSPQIHLTVRYFGRCGFRRGRTNVRPQNLSCKTYDYWLTIFTIYKSQFAVNGTANEYSLIRNSSIPSPGTGKTVPD